MQRRELLRVGGALLGPGVVASPATAGEAAPSRNAEEYRPLSRLRIPGAKEAVVGDDGWVYLATTDGYATVDASDPADPTVVADVRSVTSRGSSVPLRRIYDVKYDDDRLLVAGQEFSDRVGTLGFAVVDVSDPANPKQVLFEELDFSIHNCYLDGDVAYLTSGPDDHDSFTVYDVSGTEATELATWRVVEANEEWEAAYGAGGPSAHDLWVQDGFAYAACWDAGVFVVDVSDPADPQYVSEFGGYDPDELAAMSDAERRRARVRPPGNAHYTATDPSGDLLGVGGEAWEFEGEGGPMGIDLYDVSDPADPALRSTVDPPALSGSDSAWTTSHNFEIRDGVLYSSWYNGGVRRHDVSDPTAPVEETWWRRPDATSFWTARVLEPGETFVASTMERRGAYPGLYVFPDEPGQSQTPVESTPTPAPTSPADTATPDETVTTDETMTTDEGGTSPTAGNDSTPTDAEESMPGFGPVATVAALGVGLWRLRERAET